MKSFIPLIKSEWPLLLFGFIMLFASSPGQTYFIALFGGEIRADLGLTHGEFGSIYSLATLISAVILLWSGSLIDRMDLRHFSWLIVVGLALGCLMMALSQNVVMLFLAILLLRHFGQGLMYMTGTTAAVRYLDHQKGKANAITAMGYSVSEAILPSLIIALMLWMTWRQSWIFWGILLLITLPLSIHWLLRDHDKRHQHYLQTLNSPHSDTDDITSTATSTRRQWTRDEVIRDPLFYLFMPGLTAQPLLFTGFMFHQIHLVEEKGWSLTFWGSLYLLYALITVVAKLYSGLLVDRFGAIRLVPYIGLPMGLSLLILSTSSSVITAVLFMTGVALTVALSAIVSAPFFAEKYGNLHLGSIKSLSTAVVVFMSALSPVALGWLIDRGVSINALAMGGVVYVVLTSALAYLAYRLMLQQSALSTNNNSQHH